MAGMSVAWAALSTPLAGQAGALTVGFAGTLGGGWQVEALDVGYARALGAGPVTVAAVTARLGSFIDENAIVGGARGVVVGASLAARTPTVRLAQLGADTSRNEVGLDLTLEATGYAGSNSPLPVGSPWAAVALLPGVRFGSPAGAQYAVLLGPTVFFGAVTEVRAFLGLRFEAALARRGSGS